MLKENESKEVLKEKASDLTLDDDDVFDDDDDLLDDDDDWDEDSFLRQEQAAESNQIESFLTQTVMVRCERYNANITSLGCWRKKTSPPPKVKNAQAQEEEVIQNHPCFACLGPIWVNWPIQDPPVALHEVEERPVIVHPGIEDDFSLARERQIEAYREQYTGTRYEVFQPKPEELPSYQHVKSKQRVEAPRFPELETPAPAVEEPPAPKARAKAKPKAKAKVKEEAITPEPVALEEVPVETQEAPQEEQKPAAKAKKSKKKTTKKAVAPKAKEVTESPAEAPAEEAKPDSGDSSEAEHPPCASCGRLYEPPASKYWRGDICNPCYAKKLRKRKKKGGTTKTKAKPKAVEATDHPPCTSCGREYAPPASKYWRGDICNPCYAKKLRKRKKAKKSS